MNTYTHWVPTLYVNMDAYASLAVNTQGDMGAYNHGVPIFNGCLLFQFYGIQRLSLFAEIFVCLLIEPIGL